VFHQQAIVTTDEVHNLYTFYCWQDAEIKFLI